MDKQEGQAQVLIVDDNEKNLKILNVILRKSGYHVVAAQSGNEAIKTVEKMIPDVILLDVTMPELDGYETCKIIKAANRTKDVPIIFVSANVDTEDVIKGFESGGADYVTKPFNSEILLAKVKTYIKLMQRTKQLRVLADKDGLTGLANRRNFNEFMDLEWRRCLRSSSSLSVIMIDIDHFKLYNDTYGHLEGDSALKKVADVLKKTCRRPGDLAARYGGEEFAIILSETNCDVATVIATNICEGVERLSIPHSSSKVKDTVTVSIGVAAIIPDEAKQSEQLIKMADDQLYKSKTSGRNQVKAF